MPFWVLPPDFDGEDVMPADLENISVSGAYFRTQSEFEVGMRVRMVLHLGMGRPANEQMLVVGAGEVVRQDRRHYDGRAGTAVAVDRYYVLQPGSAVSHPLQEILTAH